MASESPQTSDVIGSRNLFKTLTENQNPVFSPLSEKSGNIAYKGIGSVLDQSNRYVFPILRGESTTMSMTDIEPTDEVSTISNVSGEQLTLVAGYQSRYNNRATISGSLHMCSDEFILLNGSVNQKFCEQLLNWNFQRSGILKTTHLRHNKKGEACKEENLDDCGPNPENYKIEDNVEFYINIEQMTEGKWHPYNAEDVQMQFRMLDPYYQVILKRVEQPGTAAYD